MSGHSETCKLPESYHRRSFLKVSGAITTMALVGATTFRGIAYRGCVDQGAARQTDSRRHSGAHEKWQ